MPGNEDYHAVMTLRLAILVCLVSASVSAQVTEHEMKRLFPTAPDGAFILEPGMTVKAVFDSHDKACTLTLRGAMSEDEVLHYFNVLVPRNIRGPKKAAEPFWCVNVCEHVISYQNVSLVTGTTGTQKSDPAAVITFSRAECRTAISEANKTTLNIRK